MVKNLLFYSGGIGSWMAARRFTEQTGEKLTLLFADTKIEDEDLYRFLNETVISLKKTSNIDFFKLSEGRTPWQVFEDVKFIGNTRVDPCSRVLKRELMERWRNQHCDKNVSTLIYGIDWTEVNRLEKIKKRLPEWKIKAPMTEPPFFSKKEMLNELKKENIEIPKLYKLGFPHNNCGGFCVKAGQAQFELLYRKMPERYAHHEKQEKETMKKIKTQSTILRDRRGGKTKPLSLENFRKQIELKPDSFDKHEFGGCGCALD